MPLDPTRVALAMNSGLSAVCATCENWWEARDKHVEGGRCLARDGCGSPLVGDDFHEYKGPVTDLATICFVCGGRNPVAFQLDVRKSRQIGVCAQHITLLRDLVAQGTVDQPGAPLVRSPLGVVPVARLFRPRKKGVLESILEVEEHYAKKAGVL